MAVVTENVAQRPPGIGTKVISTTPRVLFAVVMDPSQKFGSLEEQMAFLARQFAEEGSLFLPLFICPSRPDQPTPLERAGVPIACLDIGRFHFQGLCGLLEVIKRHRIDIVHWNFAPPLANSYVWWLTMLRPKVKHYFTDHISRTAPKPPPSGGLKWLVKRILLKRYAKVLCVSRFVFDCLEAEGAWSNLVCIKHFVNTDRFQPDPENRAEMRAKHNAGNSFVLLAVAHLIPEKGIDIVIRALTLLPECVVLWLVGGGPQADQLRDLARELGLERRIVFHGSQRHVEPFMQAADCLVCPSLWAEAAGLVNLEAQASGLPVVASRIGGIPEYVVDGQTGFLFPAGNVDELAERIQRLLTNPPLQRRFSQAACALAEEHFSPSAQLPNITAHYRS
jgi:glycosyltransferase involved in cell wall biosynthesis